MKSSLKKTKNGVLGLIAGSGELPLVFAKNAKLAGVEVTAVGFIGITSKRLKAEVATMTWVSIGQLGRMLKAFRSKNIEQIVMHGQVKLSSIYSVKPDWQGLRLIMGLKERSGEAIMRAVGSILAKHKMKLLDCRIHLKNLLPAKGLLNKVRVGSGVRRDLQTALKAAKEIARQEIGQAAVCKNGLIVALEAMEGTDSCIQRAGLIAGKGCSIVKISSAKADFRFDIPVVGPNTLRRLKNSGFQALGLEAGKSFMLGGDKFLRQAEKYKIAVVGF